PLYQQALELSKELLGQKHPDVATSLNNLAALYESQGRYEQAEPLYQQALELRKELLGHKHPSVATSLNNLAGLYRSQGRYEQAEPLYQQALEIANSKLGSAHPNTIQIANNFDGMRQMRQIQRVLQLLASLDPQVNTWIQELETAPNYSEALTALLENPQVITRIRQLVQQFQSSE
ncbi:MAG: tetratricopeptide repeat protein, partial [Cyanobacteria bacterium P01_F01_bin.33]